jgi:hypothetical protein
MCRSKLAEETGRSINLRSALVVAGHPCDVGGDCWADSGLLNSQVNLNNSGVFTTANIGIYTTSGCTQNLTSIAWGNVRAGQSYTKTGYIKNTGNLNMTLALSTSNWNPSALSSVMGMSWNYAGQKLAPGQVLAVTWTLTIPSGVTGYSGFGFDMMVTGTEA